MSANYDFFLERCRAFSGPILDYGCGPADCIKAGVEQGLDMYGVDLILDTRLKGSALVGTRVFSLTPDLAIPFPTDHFDFAYCNMVFEHVEDLDQALSELARVLKPGGTLLAAFPGRESIVEGHVRVPFVHWLPKGPAVRLPYLKFMRRLGFGAGGAGKSVEQWAADHVRWLDTFTFYRTRREILAAYQRAGFAPANVESDYLAFRLKRIGKPQLARLARGALAQSLCRGCGVQLIEARKA